MGNRVMDNKQILIVDDEPHIIRVLKLSLTQQGFHVDAARNGADALEKLNAQTYDVVITDIQMPRMTGKQLCIAMHEQYPDRMPLTLVLTSRTDLEHREWVQELPNTELLEKPVSLKWLTTRLDEHFANASALGGRDS